MYYLGVEDDGYPRGLNDQDLAGWSHLVYSVALQVRQHSSCRAAAACGEPELASSSCTQHCAHIALPLFHLSSAWQSLQAASLQAINAAQPACLPAAPQGSNSIWYDGIWWSLLQSPWPAWLP